MKVVIAPDSFKGCLSASQVARSMAAGIVAACPQARVELCPMADGGEGTVEAMVSATGGRFLSADVYNPLGQEIRARFGILGRGSDSILPGEVGLAAISSGSVDTADGLKSVAVIEMAAASGLELVPGDRLDPARATTYGTGQLIAAAMDEGVREVILGIGGSATVDCGFGCMQALGVEFFDRKGEKCVRGMGGGELAAVAFVDIKGLDPRLKSLRIRVACDVNNPLTGSNGAAMVYGPQKGADPDCVRKLEAGLVNAASILKQQFGTDVGNLEGAGAAGGLGAGLAAMAGAKLENGGKLVAEAVELESRIKGADLCLTGEGRFDSQSSSGKVPFRVASIAGKHGIPTVCIAGTTSLKGPNRLFHEIRSLVSNGVSTKKAIVDAENLLAKLAGEIVNDFLG